MNVFRTMEREELLRALEMFAKNWLAHVQERRHSRIRDVCESSRSRIVVRCLHCPPDAPKGKYCGWEFTLLM